MDQVTMQKNAIIITVATMSVFVVVVVMQRVLGGAKNDQNRLI